MLDGVLFFPVTPFGPDGAVDYGALAEHLRRGGAAGPGAVFVACGTGEFHALDVAEYARIVAAAVEVVSGAVPVFAGAGGSVVHARAFAREAARAPGGPFAAGQTVAQQGTPASGVAKAPGGTVAGPVDAPRPVVIFPAR